MPSTPEMVSEPMNIFLWIILFVSVPVSVTVCSTAKPSSSSAYSVTVCSMEMGVCVGTRISTMTLRIRIAIANPKTNPRFLANQLLFSCPMDVLPLILHRFFRIGGLK